MKQPLAVVLFFFLMFSASAMALEPPGRQELEQYRRDGTLAERIAKAKALGNHRVSPNLAARLQYNLNRIRLEMQGLTPQEIQIMAPPPDWEGMPTTGTVKILALLIDFSDYPASNTAASIESKLFGDGSGGSPYESLRNYYRRSSYNQLEIQGNVLGWYRPAYPRASVTQTTTGRQNLIKEALNYYERLGHDFTQYDNDGDDAIDYLVVIWTGPDTGWSGFWWGYMTNFTDGGYRLDGKELSTYSWQWEALPYPGTFTPRVVIHETGHALGLPDYYDYDDTLGPDGGVGDLDMMDANWGDHNCFSKFLLDWINPPAYSSGTHTITLNASGTSQDAAVVMPGAVAGNEFAEFFMVQNRYRVGNDPPNYPGEGLLIWHVDSRLSKGDFIYDNSYTLHKLLRLMEADGLEEIETFTAQADAGDYYISGRTLGPATSPDSNRYDGTSTAMTVSGISAAGSSMSFTVSFLGSPPPAPTLATPVNGTTGVSTTPILTWNTSSGATSYRLQCSTSASFSTMAIDQGGISSTSQLVSGLANNTLYYWRVNANNAGENGPWSETWSFTVIGAGVVHSFPFTDDFSTDKGWTGYETGGWERGLAVPGSSANGNPDPGLDQSYTEDNSILKFAIGEDHLDLLPEKSIVSPPIDCSEQDQVFLKFWRYLTVGSSDRAGIYVSNNGAEWTTIWESAGELTDVQWTRVVYDISSVAEWKETVYIKFTMGPTDSFHRYSGWNIDDLEVTSGYSISGLIRDKHKNPVEGIFVCFEDKTGIETAPCVQTNEYGFYIQYEFEPYDKIKKNAIYLIPHDPHFKFSPRRKTFKIKADDVKKDFKATPLNPE